MRLNSDHLDHLHRLKNNHQITPRVIGAEGLAHGPQNSPYRNPVVIGGSLNPHTTWFPSMTRAYGNKLLGVVAHW